MTPLKPDGMFNDEDLKRLKELNTRLHDGILNRTIILNNFSDYEHIEYVNYLNTLLVRLEAAESIILQAKKYTDTFDVYVPLAESYEVWRKSKGE